MTLTDEVQLDQVVSKAERRRALTRTRVARHRAKQRSPIGLNGPGAVTHDAADWLPDPARDDYPMVFLQKRGGVWELSEFGAGMDLARLLAGLKGDA